MTVINVHVGEQAIHILSDTLVYAGDTPIALCGTKCDPIGDQAVMACRGQVRVARLHRELFTDVGSLDAYVERLPMILAEYEAAGFIDAEGHEIVASGYSPARRRLLAVLGRVDADTRSVTVEEFGPGWHMAPDLGAKIMQRVPSAYSQTVAERLALAQWKLSSTAGWGFCIGGCMTLTTITEIGTLQRIIGTYPDYAEHLDRFGDPNESAVAGFAERVAA
ncbi:hypothetical protein FHW79_001675 [Azospirillum sp. OGB3]|uniref:hypothetical protein n=1 Tax=Azospirillum sp. OGB3 TaxID=2587012 RepID=UPI0016067F98|nr:hypothetical protein [Azospirillum sp. OGB3]MBB3264060.1 hypothetical protein [Azospirillum sp. OGB3]